MPITIEEIKKLNAERTQGYKGKVGQTGLFLADNNGAFLSGRFARAEDLAFCMAAPAIAQLAISQNELIERLKGVLKDILEIEVLTFGRHGKRIELSAEELKIAIDNIASLALEQNDMGG